MDDQPRFDERGWLKPQFMGPIVLRLYRERFGGGQWSYKLHYDVAVGKGNRLSVLRMDWLAERLALARMRGEFR